MSYVYFIKPIGARGPIKIGKSANVGERLAGLAAWSPIPLEIVATIEATHMHERRFHRLFYEQHEHREWFSWSQKLEDVIAEVLAGTFDLESLPPPLFLHNIARWGIPDGLKIAPTWKPRAPKKRPVSAA